MEVMRRRGERMAFRHPAASRHKKDTILDRERRRETPRRNPFKSNVLSPRRSGGSSLQEAPPVIKQQTKNRTSNEEPDSHKPAKILHKRVPIVL